MLENHSALFLPDHSFVYSISDAAIVGQTLSGEQVAGVNDIAPIVNIFLQFAFGVSAGFCVITSCNVGSHNQPGVRRSLATQIVLSAVLTLLLTALALALLNPMLAWINVTPDSGAVYTAAFTYCAIIFAGIGAQLFYNFICSFLRAMGDSVTPLMFLLFSTVLNVGLDLLFILSFGWGVAGAAIATVAGQALTAGLSIWYLTRMKQIHLQKDSFRPRAHLLGKCAKLGMTSFLAQISLVAAMAATNTMLRICSAQDAVFSQEEFSAIPMAVFGIVMKVFQIVISCAIGLAAGCIPVAGYNMGAGRHDRVKGLLTRLLAAEAVVGLIALLVVELLPDQVMLLFGAQNESIHYTLFARRCFRVYLSMIVLACINKGTFIFLQSLGKAAASTLLSMAREIVFGVGLVLLLPQFFQLDGVMYSMPAADVLTAILSAVVLVRTYRSLETEK